MGGKPSKGTKKDMRLKENKDVATRVVVKEQPAKKEAK